MSCDAPEFPSLREPWVLVGWPTAPRFTSVEAEGAILYATTTSTVCRSMDGGRHWTPVLIDLDAPVLVAVEGGRIVVRAEEAWEGREDVTGVWWVTDDGAHDWSRHERPPEVGQGRIERIAVHTREVDGEFAAVSCGDALFAVVPSPRGRAPLALRSDDSGLTWSRMNIPPRLRELGTTFRCIGHDAVALERGGAVPLVTAFSRDRGRRWETLVRLPIIARAPADNQPSDDALPSSGCAPLAGRGVFCEVSGQGWATSDLGRRWYRANSPVGGRTLPMHGEFLLGIGGGVALSTDAGRRWEIVTVAPGSANLGTRGAVLSPTSYWLAGSALWWTDDGGQRWTASQLPWELVTVLSRRRWVGLRPAVGQRDDCGGTVMLTTTAGRTWRPVLGPRVKRVTMRDGELRAMQCGEPAHVFASRDGVAWRAVSPRPDDEVEDVEDEGPIVVEGMSLELSDGVLRSTRAGAASEVIAGAWPRDILPVAASAVDARASVVVFGNGTVLRRP
jgi:photosystem II stability/assembly factor-like uncharacterized protein